MAIRRLFIKNDRDNERRGGRASLWLVVGCLRRYSSGVIVRMIYSITSSGGVEGTKNMAK